MALQQPIRILDAVAWGDDVGAAFWASGATQQPLVDADYYRAHRPVRFDPQHLRTALRALESRLTKQIGGSAIEGLLAGRVREYLRVIDLLEARGTPGVRADLC